MIISTKAGGGAGITGAAQWGLIAGTLSDQTDLSSVLSGKSDVGHIHNLSALTEDTTHRLVTDTEKNTWNAKQDAGSYEVTTNKVTSISGSSTDVQYPSAKLLYDQLAGKQPTGAYLTSVTADSPLSGAGTAASHLTVDLSSKQDTSVNLTSLAGLTYVSAAFVKMTSANTFTLDTTTYLTSLSGAVLTDQATPQTVGDTDHRLLKLWATDITCTNAITGSVTGNAGTATILATARAINGTNFDGSAAITIPVNNTDDVSTNATVYPLWTATAGGNYAAKVSTTKLYFNPSTGMLTATGFTGPLTGTASGNLTSASTLDASKLSGTIPSAVLGNSSLYIGTTSVALNRASNSLSLTGVSIDGNAATVTTNANLTGPITSSGNATSIASQTGTGTKFVVDTSPTIVTPIIASLIGNKIYPSVDSTTAIQINKADGTTNVLNVDTTNSRVGIGTTTPSVALDVVGNAKFTNVGFLDTAPDSKYGMYANKSYTDPASGVSTLCLFPKPTYTGAESVSESFYGLYLSLRPLINAGHTNSGGMYGAQVDALRNYNGVSADDSGTLDTLRSCSILYGHYNSDTGETPLTTSAYGVYIIPYYKTGTITNMYDIYIAANSTGGTATNKWGFYQTNADKNYFAGNIGIGSTAPAYTLDVNGLGALGSNAAGTIDTVTENQFSIFRGCGIASGGHTYGSYGGFILNSNTTFTANARKFLVTNALLGNRFGIIRSVDASTTPSLTEIGAVASGTADIVITYEGKIGLGVTTPTSKLSFGTAGDTISMDTTDGSDTKYLQLAGGGTASITRGASVRLHGNESSGETGNLYLYAGDVGGNINFTTYSTGKFIFNTGYVGIGSTSPSTNLDVVGNAKFTNVGILDTAPSASYGLYANKSYTDPGSGITGIYAISKPTYTGAETASEYFYGQFLTVKTLINAGHTNSGIITSLYLENLRNYNGASVDDSGTLSNLKGIQISYGSYNSDTGETPVTTNAYGLYIQPYYGTGTFTTMYDIFINSNITGGTVTNKWGIYQTSADKNYFRGNIGIGTTIPSVELDVVGNAKFTNVGFLDTAPSASVGLYASKIYTNPTNVTYGIYGLYTMTYTGAESVAESFYGLDTYVRPIVNAGHTNSGNMINSYSSVMRNNYAAGSDDDGTLNSLSGQQIVYGHNNTNASATPVTTSAYGIYIAPYYRTGTITNMYDVYIATSTTGGAVTNKWGFYQVNADKNYLAGNVGIGVTTPLSPLHINKDLDAPDDLGDFDNYHLVIQGGSATGKIAGILLTTTADTYGGSAIVSYDVGEGGLSDLAFFTKQGTTAIPPVEVMRLTSAGRVGIGSTAPTAYLNIKAGTATASTAPIKLTTGTVNTNPEAGAIEYNNTFHVVNSDSIRRHIMTAASATKTTAAAPYTNDGYITINIGGTDVKVMTTA